MDSDAEEGDFDCMNDTLCLEIYFAYEQAKAFEKTIGIVIPTIFAIVIFIGVMGNSLVMMVVVLNRQMRTSTNALIINLALSDLLFLIFCVPFTAADYALPIWVFSRMWCGFLFYFQFVTAYASVWTLVLMAFDRFLAVIYPVQSITLRSVKNTVFVVIALWVVILLANLNILDTYGIHEYEFVTEKRHACSFVDLLNSTATEEQVLAHYLAFNVFGYFAPLFVTCVLYFFVLEKLWFGMPMARSRLSEESMRAKRKVTWMVTGVIVTFAVCWLPLNICFAITAFMYRQHQRHFGTQKFGIFTICAQVLAYSNSCANPILYAFLSENFRQGFSRIFTCAICRSKNAQSLNRRNASYQRSEIRCTPTSTEASVLVVRSLSVSNNRRINIKRSEATNGETVCLNNSANVVAPSSVKNDIVLNHHNLLRRRMCEVEPAEGDEEL